MEQLSIYLDTLKVWRSVAGPGRPFNIFFFFFQRSCTVHVCKENVKLKKETCMPSSTVKDRYPRYLGLAFDWDIIPLFSVPSQSYFLILILVPVLLLLLFLLHLSFFSIPSPSPSPSPSPVPNSSALHAFQVPSSKFQVSSSKSHALMLAPDLPLPPITNRALELLSPADLQFETCTSIPSPRCYVALSGLFSCKQATSASTFLNGVLDMLASRSRF